MTRYEFVGDNVMILENWAGKKRVIDLGSFEMYDPDDEQGLEDIRYLFEANGEGEKNPFATEEQLEEWYGICR